jgi:hypothetical protein
MLVVPEDLVWAILKIGKCQFQQFPVPGRYGNNSVFPSGLQYLEAVLNYKLILYISLHNLCQDK